MTRETNKENTVSSAEKEPEPEAKPGFFTRVFGKLDSALKQKAEAKAAQGCCCKDGKC